jgi:hypothetical protein
MSYRKQLPAKRLGLGLVATALLVSSFSGALLSQDSPTPDQGDHESHARANNEAYAWANNPADRNWRVELPVPVRNLLTLTGAGTTRHPDQVDNDPASGLALAGSTAMFADATGSALWPNCTPIRVTIDTVESSADSTAAALATRDAVIELAELTGLEFTPITASAHTTGDDPAPRSNTIQIIWVDRDTGLLEDHELGSAEVWHLEVIDRLIVFQAVVLLSDEILTKHDPGTAAGTASVRTTLLHELGHTVGIGHSADDGSVMYPKLTGKASVTTADQAAFAYAGSRGC